YLCSADLREFMSTHHLDRTMGTSVSSNGRHVHSAGFGTTVALPTRFNPRKAFGTATPKDHSYNTPRAWYMQRRLNPSAGWDL
ncbi:C69 family dipeptidase, partial [Bifidobacterium longum]|uniref:C69 family dipeptidase n=1 Tax=Bifidobacterium longum TaxID=216816 RepID=UPI000D56FB38